MPKGKGYKKRSTEDEQKAFELDTESGEMLGRVLRALGNRRFRVYCNDNKERICKLAGSIRKSQWCEEGTIVVLASRGMGSAFGHGSANNAEEIADILAVVEPKFYSKLKKEKGVNPALFANLHDQDIDEVKKRVAAGQGVGENDDLFDRDSSDSDSEEEDEEGAGGLSVEEKKKAKELARAKKEKERDLARGAKREEKHVDDTFNIDDI